MWRSYLKDTWTVYPIYCFYETGYNKLPDNKNKYLYVYSTIRTNNLEFGKEIKTNFFTLYEAYPGSLNTPIGYVIKFDYLKDVKYRFTHHGISACTNVMTKKETTRVNRSIIYDKQHICIVGFGNDAEIVTDISKVLGVSL